MTQVDKDKAQGTGDSALIGQFPCTQTQLRCWIIDQIEPGNPALNVAVRWEIRGVFKATTIEAALRKVIERHEVLRTRIVEVDGKPVQQVVAETDFKMSVIDLRNVAADAKADRVSQIAHETASAPFDLTQPKLFRVSLLVLENDRAILLITAHQSCFDGWSIRVLGREVGAIAAALDAGTDPDVPDLPLQYGDYALWQSEYMESYGFEAEKAFWIEKLGDAPYFEVPPDHPRNARKSNRGDILSISRALDFDEQLSKAARAHQVSMYSLGVAVISGFLHRYTGQDTVLVGSQIAGRDDKDLEDLIGVFINNLVLRLDLNPDAVIADHIHAASLSVAEAINNQRMPFNKLVELINPPRDATRNPLISVNFNLQKAFLQDQRYGNFELISAPSQSPGVIYDLNFIMVGRPAGWRLSLEYNCELFDRETAQDILDAWHETWNYVFANPQAPLSTLPVMQRRVKAPADLTGAHPLALQLAAHPALKEAYVVQPDGAAPLAFVTPAPDYTGAIDGLAQTLLTDLPGLPLSAGRISVLLALPRTRNGEIDADRLAKLATVRAQSAAAPAPVIPTAPPPPRGAPTQAQIDALAGIWAEVLEIPSVGPQDSFFELGGHSLLALRMISRVQQLTGTKADLALLFTSPRLDDFASHVFMSAPDTKAEPDTASDPWEMITFRQGTGALAVYTINHPFLYAGLTQVLPEHIAIHNINMFGVDIAAKVRNLDFEQIAARAVAHIDSTRNNRPVALLGLCVNGVLAVEIARQLRAADCPVRFVGLIDAWSPNTFVKLPKGLRRRVNLRKRVQRVVYQTGLLLRRRMSLVAYLKKFDATLRLLSILGVRSGKETPDEIANGVVTNLLVQASRKHDFSDPIDGSVYLFKSQAMHPVATRERFGWTQQFPQGDSVIALEGWHEDALAKSGMAVIADKIVGSLRTAP